MEADPEAALLVWKTIDISAIVGIFTMVILLLISALISGSEVAFFSLSPTDIEKLKSKKTNINNAIIDLLSFPKRALATILITNNFVNIGIVLVSSFVLDSLIDFSYTPFWLVFSIQVVVVTFLLLLFGEVIPKVYANAVSLKFARFMALPLEILDKIFRPFTVFLVKSTSIFDRKFEKHKQNFSVNDLSEALKLTQNVKEDEKEILEGIVSFGNIDVNGVMTPRVDVVAIEFGSDFGSLIDIIKKSGFSRIPVYKERIDNIKGLIYTKDLLPYVDEKEDFEWNFLIREPYFVPETKKINELLEEFQEKKIHMAIVVDEYGGANGVVTIEDILEEILGDMNDENDDEISDFEKLDEKNYIFNGKTPLYDFYKILDIDNEEFEQKKGDADTLAGLILEIKGEFPKKGERFSFKSLDLVVEKADVRRIIKVKVEKKM